MYFLTGFKNPTRTSYDFFDDPVGRTERIERLLQHHEVNAVVINSRPQVLPAPAAGADVVARGALPLVGVDRLVPDPLARGPVAGFVDRRARSWTRPMKEWAAVATNRLHLPARSCGHGGGSNSRARRIAMNASSCRPNADRTMPSIRCGRPELESSAMPRRHAASTPRRHAASAVGESQSSQKFTMPTEVWVSARAGAATAACAAASRAWPHVERRGVAVDGTSGVGHRRTSPRQPVVRIERNRLTV